MHLWYSVKIYMVVINNTFYISNRHLADCLENFTTLYFLFCFSPSIFFNKVLHRTECYFIYFSLSFHINCLGVKSDEAKFWQRETETTLDFQRRFRTLAAQLFFKVSTESEMARDANNAHRRCTASSSKMAWPLKYSVGVPSQPSSERAVGEIRRPKVNFVVKNLDDQDEVSLELSVFQ